MNSIFIENSTNKQIIRRIVIVIVEITLIKIPDYRDLPHATVGHLALVEWSRRARRKVREAGETEGPTRLGGLLSICHLSAGRGSQRVGGST